MLDLEHLAMGAIILVCHEKSWIFPSWDLEILYTPGRTFIDKQWKRMLTCIFWIWSLMFCIVHNVVKEYSQTSNWKLETWSKANDVLQETI